MRINTSGTRTLGDQREELAERLPSLCEVFSVDTELGHRVARAFVGLDSVRFKTIENAMIAALGDAAEAGAHLDVSTNIVKAMRLYLTFLVANKRNRGFVASTKSDRKILDIGSGSGSWSFICNALGHESIGLDVPQSIGFSKEKAHTSGPLNSLNMNVALMKWYDVSVIEHVVAPQVPFPVSAGSFDDFVIFAPTFHRRWTEDDWDFLFADLSRCARKADSALYLKINTEKMKAWVRENIPGAQASRPVPAFIKAVDKLDHQVIGPSRYIVALK